MALFDTFTSLLTSGQMEGSWTDPHVMKIPMSASVSAPDGRPASQPQEVMLHTVRRSDWKRQPRLGEPRAPKDTHPTLGEVLS